MSVAQQYLIQAHIESLLASDKDEFSFEEVMHPIEQFLENKIKQYDDKNGKIVCSDFLSLSASFYIKRFLERTCCCLAEIPKLRLQKTEKSLEGYFTQVKSQLKMLKKNSANQFPKGDISIIKWLEIFRTCQHSDVIGTDIYLDRDIDGAYREMRARIFCAYFNLDYNQVIKKIKNYSKCTLQEAIAILERRNADELIKLCLDYHEFGAYIEVSNDIVTLSGCVCEFSISKILGEIESNVELKSYQHSYDGLARLMQYRQDDYEEITLEHLRKGGVIKARDKRDILFFQNSLSDLILGMKDRLFYVDLQKTKLQITRDDLVFVKEELESFLIAHPEIKKLKGRTTKCRRQNTKNSFRSVCEGEYKKLSDNGKKHIMADKMWEHLSELAEDESGHPTIMEVTEWTEQKAYIVYKSFRGGEKTIHRDRFETVLSEIRKKLNVGVS